MSYKLGSLFDGSGGFPLAGSLCGIEPRWASEVEPYPIAVTRARFPNMKHLGDISKINGAEIEPVDIITFGSPCQDLSVAGKRAGLKHEANGDEETTRSGLFMEAVRIIKEMREATNGLYPRFALWENVPGAFSSNKGEDFRVVCEELIKIIEPAAVMPAVPKNGWPYSDSYIGDGWSLAYRVFDAQYWGVPQRRRRIHLVVDFRGECAREILFEREGVRGYFAEGRTPWQAAAGNAEDSAGADDRAGENGGGAGRGRLDGIASAGFKPGQGPKARGIGWEEEKSPTLAAEAGGNSVPAVCYGVTTKGNGDAFIAQERCATLTAGDGMPGQGYAALVPYTLKVRCGKEGGGGAGGRQLAAVGFDTYNTDDKAPTVTAAAGMSGNNQSVVCYPDVVDQHILDDQGGSQITVRTDEKSPTLRAEMHGNAPCVMEPKAYGIGNGQANQSFSAVRIRYIVRRLPPTECARLQGFADRWGDIDKKDSFTPEEYRFWLDVRRTYDRIQADAVIEAAKRVIEAEEAKSHPDPDVIKKQQEIIARAELRKEKTYTEAQMLTWYNKLHTDSAEYKMWGNGIALPPALYCMQGIMDALIGSKAQPTVDMDKSQCRGTDTEAVAFDDYNFEVTGDKTCILRAGASGGACGVTVLQLVPTPESSPEVHEEPPATFDAVGQLKHLAAERRALARIHPESDRFTNDARAIEYAVSILEAVGL